MDVSPETSAEPRNARAAFALLGTVQLLLNASVSVTFAAGPAMQRELGLGRVDLILDSAAYGISFSGLLLLGGRLADRVGPRRLFSRGTALFAAASLAAALAPVSHAVLAARFLQGCGAALAAPAAMALLRAVFPEGRARAVALARWGLLTSLGAAVGIVLSGALSTWASWRWSFGVLAVVALAALASARRALPAGPAPVRVPVDLLGAVLGTLALTTLGYGFVMAGPHGWTAAVLGPLALGAVLLGAFAAVQRRVAAPLLPLGFLASRYRATALVCALLGPAIGAATAFLLALYVQQVRGWSALENALAFVPYSAVLIGVGLVAGRIVARHGARAVAVAGLAVIACGLFLIGTVGLRTDSAVPVLAGLVVLSAGNGLLMSAAVVGAVAGVPEGRAALAGAVVNTAILAGPPVSLALITSAADARTATLLAAGDPHAATGGYAFAFEAACAVFAAAIALAGYGLSPRRRSRTAGPSAGPSAGHAADGRPQRSSTPA
ncbi:MFS transporter [Streptomyces sp. BR123]|uniref:MFS transporter n=1 Tax=Streptomyces sp. BR123 TaxID=2749828 RepID=UPI0015C46D7C|nr:MFS transporter [Streptomyces sp. BR123]NXY98496.1 MFS transporter [Streptomyces sp. BR123]